MLSIVSLKNYLWLGPGSWKWQARLQRFSCKLIATESELYRRKSESTQERQVPSMPLDTVKPSEGMEHFKLTPRVRRRRIVSHPQRTCSSDCEACEINNECTTQCDSPTGAWWFSDSEEDHHVIDSEFQDFQVGKFDCSDRSLDDTICPQGDSVLAKLHFRCFIQYTVETWQSLRSLTSTCSETCVYYYYYYIYYYWILSFWGPILEVHCEEGMGLHH